jgi:hypothetical protein
VEPERLCQQLLGPAPRHRPLIPESTAGVEPKGAETCITWADTLQSAVSRPVPGVPVLAYPGCAMIFGLRA